MNLKKLNVLKFEKKDLPIALIASYLLLVPFGRLSTVPMAVMALLGLVLLVKKSYTVKNPEVAAFSLLFAAFWIPVLLSLPDAVNVEKTAKVALVFFSYWLAGLFIVHCLRNDLLHQKKLLYFSALIVFLWIADAMFQMVFGFNTFGYESRLGALNGFFGEGHPKMGIYLAALCPFLLVYVLRYRSLLVSTPVILITCTALLLAGRRGGWIMLAVILVFLVFWFVQREKKISMRSVMVTISLIVVCFVSAYYIYPPVTQRIDQTLLVFKGDLNSVDNASSFRLPIWNTAVDMIKSNPVNGVGARGFRYAYRSYATTGDMFIQEDDSLGAFYAHQILLGIGSGTGFIGLTGFIAACWLLIRRWFRFCHSGKMIALPYGLALLAIFFPLNTHYATYSSHWSSLIFWLLALYSSVLISSSEIAEKELD